MAKADDWFKKALPFMEKCLELEPDDRGTMESLKTLYYRINDLDKYNEMIDRLGE